MFSFRRNAENLRKLFLELKHYIELQREFMQLEAAEKTTVLLSTVLIVVVALILSGFVFLFLAFALAWYLGDVLKSMPAGFGITAVVIVLLTWVFYVNRVRFVINPVAKFMTRLFVSKKDGGQ